MAVVSNSINLKWAVDPAANSINFKWKVIESISNSINLKWQIRDLVISNSISMRWSFLQEGIPHIEFKYPYENYEQIVRIYQGIQNNVPNRIIRKTVKRTRSAGNVYNFRNIGYNQELLRVDIVLSTKQEARDFTNFFKNVIKGSSGIFYYKNNLTGIESVVRLMQNELSMGEVGGHPYSFSLLLLKIVYARNSLTMKWHTIIRAMSMFSGGRSHAAAIDREGRLYTIGDNSSGQIGQEATGVFNRIGIESNWVKVTCGQGSTIALNSNGELYGTGDNSRGSLGLGHNNQVNTFTRIGTDTDWADIAIGCEDSEYEHTLAKKSNNNVYSTGFNFYGQLGLNDTVDRNTFVLCDTNVDKIAAGGWQSFFIKMDGSLWSWGDNWAGQLGLGDDVDRIVPTRVGLFSDWIDISTGERYALGIRGVGSIGSLWSWGENGSGQLGLGDYTDRLSPVQVGLNTDWSNITCGLFMSSYGKASSVYYSWGRGAAGALGLGDYENYNTPQAIAGVWDEIWAGFDTAYGIKPDYSSYSNDSSQQTVFTLITMPVRSNSINLKWEIGPMASNSLNLSWRVKGPISNSINLNWRIIQNVSNLINFEWLIISPPAVGDENEFIWDIV